MNFTVGDVAKECMLLSLDFLPKEEGTEPTVGAGLHVGQDVDSFVSNKFELDEGLIRTGFVLHINGGVLLFLDIITVIVI